jgi:hypothetical protein
MAKPKEKARGELGKVLAREMELEIPKSAAQVKLRSVGSKVIKAFSVLATKRGELPRVDDQ